MNNREDKTLTLAAALGPSKGGRNRISPDSGLIEQAVREGVAGILYKSLLTSGALGSLDQGDKETLKTFYYQTTRMNLLLMHALKQVLSQVNQRGIAVVVLQGMALLNDPYEDIGLRPMTDIDLWVSRQEYKELIHILGVLGYKRDHVYASTFNQGSTVFDIHTHILWADRIRARKLLLGRSEECLIGEVRTIEIEGEKALCLSPYDQVLYLSLHAFKHCLNKLIWLVDIQRILERWSAGEWARLVSRARDLRQEKTLLCILFLLERVFHFRTPPDALELLQGKKLNPLEKRILRARVMNGSLPFWGPVLLFSSELGPVNQCLFLLENLYPRIEVLRQVFPSPPNLKPLRLYGKRTLQLLGMLKRAIRGD